MRAWSSAWSESILFSTVLCFNGFSLFYNRFKMDMFLSNSSQINTTLPTEDWTTVSSHSGSICLYILVNGVCN